MRSWSAEPPTTPSPGRRVPRSSIRRRSASCNRRAWPTDDGTALPPRSLTDGWWRSPAWGFPAQPTTPSRSTICATRAPGGAHRSRHPSPHPSIRGWRCSRTARSSTPVRDRARTPRKGGSSTRSRRPGPHRLRRPATAPTAPACCSRCCRRRTRRASSISAGTARPPTPPRSSIFRLPRRPGPRAPACPPAASR